MGRFAIEFALLFAVVQISSGQTALPPELAEKVGTAIDRGESAGELACRTTPVKPFLDFALRFEAGFFTTCGLAQFEGNSTHMAAYLRVTPAGRRPAVFGDAFTMPAAPAEKRKQLRWNRFKDEVEFSGAVALGEGIYQIEYLVADEHNRTYRKKWEVKIEARGKEKSVEPTLAAYSIAAVSAPPWRRSANAGRQPAVRRVTVLMDAAPIWPTQTKLRAWDRAFLLSSLASLLHQIDADRIRLVAFNLDQQREIYREDNFDRQGLRNLAGSLQELELGTVSYKSLQRENGWADLLVKLINDETSQRQPPDAVIFLGPNSRILAKIAPEYVRARADIGQRLYYFEYFARVGYEFPDAIHSLTTACRGTVFKLHSPADFAASLAKLQRRLEAESPSPTRID